MLREVSHWEVEMLVIVPSRGRPRNIADLIESWKITRDYAELLVVMDSDDDTLEGYKEVADHAPDWTRFAITDRKRLGPTLNEYALRNVAGYDVIGFMGDDHRPRTPHWDRRLAIAISSVGGVGISYGNDLIQGPNLPTAVWMSSCIIETLGYMVPPNMIHLYLDNFWKTLGERLQRLVYEPDVIIEHMHPVAGKAVWDDRYAEVNDGSMYENDGKIFAAYVSQRLNADVERVVERCVLR